MESKDIIENIKSLAKKTDKPLRIMEVCGTHTMSIFRHGIRQLLPKNIELVSGPGCPVCVTDDSYMDKAIAYAKREDVIITTFGDMLKVPGSNSSLAEAKANGADIRIIYSPLDSIGIAKENSDKKVVFLAVGFETTAPTAAALTLAAKNDNINNLFLLSSQKLVPPALKLLLDDDEVKVDGFLLPGHVAVITGLEPFQFVSKDYRIPGVVAGFEAKEILSAIYLILAMLETGDIKILNAYKNVVKDEGNSVARDTVDIVYEKTDALWRGIGKIPLSGLKMRQSFAEFDIEQQFPVTTPITSKKTACRCGEVLKGIVTPKDCPLFAKACAPTHAIGPCMVSVEGVCAAYYKYGRNSFEFV